jgi:hypothetical protein
MGVRIGLFKYVVHSQIDEHHKMGWMIVSDLGGYHAHFSVLMWKCECK